MSLTGPSSPAGSVSESLSKYKTVVNVIRGPDSFALPTSRLTQELITLTCRLFSP